MEPQQPVGEGSSGELETAAQVHPEQAAPLDARDLVSQMVAAGEWPTPTLVEHIAASGDAAVEPLREIIRTRPLGWPAEAPIVHAAGILSMQRPPSALPDLIAAARFYEGDSGEFLADVIAAYGSEGFDALLNLIIDPSITGFHRTDFITAAKHAAGDDPVRRTRLAEHVRQVFERVVGEVKESLALRRELRESGKQKSESEAEYPATVETTQPGSSDVIDEIRQMGIQNEIHPTGALAFLTCDLVDLADPLAHDMIRATFDQGLIDEEIINLKSVERIYEQGGEIFEPARPWFEEYSESYLEEHSLQEQKASTPQVEFPSLTSYPSFGPASAEATPPRVQSVEPFRHPAPKIGRNDPCWCGSGKKYKKCHLGQDAPR